ncbi:MAG: hypothetical protein ACTTKD_07945 [Peptoanaerobacter stomatis]|uniref:hypothetical protein n=1 Tax=Peptoanaerobacter stomatis TaxID=796937 RepID=UPI003FA01E0C
MKYRFLNKPILQKKHISFTNTLDYTIYLFLLFFIFIDWITGIALQSGFLSIGVPYKIFLMMLIFLGIKSEKKIVLLLYFVAAFFLSSFAYFFQISIDTSSAQATLLKTMMLPFLSIYLEDTYKSIPQGKYILKQLCTINAIIIIFNQMLGILGYGNSTYGGTGGTGIKGFFYDGNAITVVCFCLFVFFYSFEKNRPLSLLLFFSAFLLGTKTSVLAIALYFFTINYLSVTRKRKILILLVFLCFIFLIFYLINYTKIFAYHIATMQRLHKAFDGHILSMLLSGRNEALKTQYIYYKEHFSITNFFWGTGGSFNNELIELDFFDTFFSYGLIFCIPITLNYLYYTIHNRTNKKLLIFNIMIILITFTSGHVWYNTATALFYVINNIYNKVEKNEIRCMEKY